MRYQVHLTPKAERDVDQVLCWFHRQRATVAGGRWFAKLMARIQILERGPLRCRLAAEAQDVGMELRELLFGNRKGKYRILFVIQENFVFIVHIRHTARDALSSEDVT